MSFDAKKSVPLAQIAQVLGLEYKGRDLQVTGLNSLEEASSTELSFFTDARYSHQVETTKACAIFVSPENADKVPNPLISNNPYMDFAKAGAFFVKKQGEYQGLSSKANIDESAKLGDKCIVYPFAFIGPRAKLGEACEVFPGAYIGEDVILGKNCIIQPNATVMAGVSLGDNCVVKAGAVVGSDGFGFIRMDGKVQKIPQTGTVSLHDNVEIGANTCVDKAHIGTTRIEEETKIDNLVQIGHNVQIGKQSFIVSQVGIAGSARIGDRATFAGQTGIAGHLVIGDDVTIAAKSGVAANIASGTVGGGIPFASRRVFSRNLVLIPKIPDLFRQVSQLEKQIVTLKKKLADNNKE